MAELKVLFDAYWWTEGPFSNRTVQREIVSTWRSDYPADVMHLALPRGEHDTEEIERLGLQPHVTRARLHPELNRLWIPKLAHRLDVDTVLTHNFSAGRDTAVFIHDLIFLEHRAWFTPVERAYLSLIGPMARGSLVLTSSDTERARIARFVKQPTAVVGVGLAVPRELSAVPSPTQILEGRQFALAVGRLNERKNLAVVINAARQCDSINRECPLVIVGEASGRGVDLSQVAGDLLSEGSVVHLQRVPSEALSWLYGHASVFLSMSRDEGFGMPVIEAREFGCPLILSDVPIMHEVGGERAVYISPDDPSSLAREIDATLRASNLRPTKWTISWSDVVREIRNAMILHLGSGSHV